MRLRGLVFALAVLVVLGLPAGAAAEGACPNEALREEQHSTFLPDCRAYEQVSPPDKKGGDVSVNATRTRAARELAPGEAMAVQFASLAGFGDVLGTGVGVDYMGVRTGAAGTQGWTTHSLVPRINEPLTAQGVPFRMEPAYVSDFSGDLSQGVFQTWSALSEAPSVRDHVNIYLREDLRTPGAGSFQLLSGCPFCDATATPLPALMGHEGQTPSVTGASSDFGHVIFESNFDLTADAPPCLQPPESYFRCPPKLYESDHGTLRLAGILPNGEAAPASIAGQGTPALVTRRTYTPHTVSADGSRVIFTDSSTGSDRLSGTLYMRIDHATTVQINASERTDCAIEEPRPCTGAPAPDPGGPQPARYQDASVDGSRVFFISGENLTDDAVASGAGKLYMYDASRPASDPHNLTLLSVNSSADSASEAMGVIGASDDGRYVYFVGGGQFVAGAPLLGSEWGIFLWHNGTVSYGGPIPGAVTGHPGEAVYEGDNFASAKWDFLGWGQARVSPDGRHLLFASYSGEGLTGYDQQGHRELYVYNADTERVQCVSCNPNGTPATADPDDMSVAESISYEVRTSHLSRALSADGSRVFFNTQEALVPQDTNGKFDAYEYDTTTGEVHLLSSGKSANNSYFMDASPSGNDVFIVTAERLVGWDVDGNYDLYDVRVDGGFPEPRPPAPGCSGEACREQTGAAPSFALPGSSALSGSGNLSAPASKPLLKHKPKRKPKGKARPKRRSRKHRARRARKSRARSDVRVNHRVGR